jgi:hypothetical protein
MSEPASAPDGDRLSRRDLAIHEAGHAIVAALLGQKILWVSIAEENGGSGQTEPITNHFLRLDEPFESRRRVIIAMAGSAAQCIAAGCNPRWLPSSSGTDKSLAEENSERAECSADDFSAVTKILRNSEVWEKVESLAEVLLLQNEILSWNGLGEFLPDQDATACQMAGLAAR